jgi:hypothetical protein
MTADLGSLRGHAGPKYALSGHSRTSTLMFWLPSPTSASSSPTACQRLDVSSLHTFSLCSTLLHLFLVFFLDQQNRSFSRPSSTHVLFSYWFSRWSCEGSAVTFCPTGEPMGTDAHSSISLLLPMYSSAVTLVFCSARWTLKMEAICSTETSAHFHRTTGRYITEDNYYCENLNSYTIMHVLLCCLS